MREGAEVGVPVGLDERVTAKTTPKKTGAEVEAMIPTLLGRAATSAVENAPLVTDACKELMTAEEKTDALV